MALTRLGTDQIADSAITNAKISASADIAGSKLEDDMTYGSNLTVSGNLVVNGTTTTVDTTNMSIEDPLLVFSSGASGSASVDAGFVVERGDDTNVGLIWDESADKFNFVTTNETGSTAGNVTVAGQANIIAGNIEGTITTAAQNSITSATGLVSVGAIGTGSWAATDVAVAHGGTGSSTAGGARTNLGVVIGTDVQAYDAELAAIAGLTSAADKGIQFTGSGTAAVYDLTAAGKALLDDANAAAQLVTLGVTATAAEITASIDGDTSATATTLADADRVVVNDGGTMKQVALTDFETYFEAGLDTLNAVTSASSLATVGTIGTGVWQGTDVGVAHGGTGASTAAAALSNLGAGTEDSPQFTGIELGHATDTTITRSSGGVLAVEGNVIYHATGTDIPVTDGGTGSSTAAGALVNLGLAATAAEINIMDGGTSATSTTLADADRFVVNDNGTMVQVAMTDLEVYMETSLDTLNAVTSASALATVGTITSGVWSGTAIVDAKVDNDLTISGGSVDASIVGGSTPAAGTFTTLTANDQLVVAAGVSITGDTTDEITLNVKGVGSQTANLMTVEISDGTDKFQIASDGSVVVGQDLTLASGATVNAILDQDTMSGDSATSLATQQSIKAYVDSSVGASALTIGADAGSDDTVTVGTDTLNVSGGANITTTVSDNDISIALDATITSGITALTAGQLNADNIRIDGNVISSTDTDGNITLTPNGTGDVVISGDLTVNGTTTTVNSTVVTLDDPIMQLGGDSAPGSDDDKDRGVAFRWHNGSAAKNGWFGYDDSISKFTFVPDATITSEVISGTVGNAIFGNIEGTITTAAQNSITSATGIATLGTITTGAWQGTDVGVAHGGTGSSTASGARTNLGVAIGSDVQAYDAQLADVAGLAVTDGGMIVGDGSNFVLETGATLRTSLGVGTGDSPQLTAVNVGHASDTTLARSSAGVLAVEGNVIYHATGTDVPLTDGGTGSSTAGGARTNLGVVIGTDVQAYDAELAAIAGLTSAANKGIQFTGDGTAAVYDLTAAGKALLDDANAAAQLVTLGVTATAAEITAAVDGSTSATSTTLADADRVVVNDNGTMVQVALTDFETYFEAGLDTLNAVTSASALATVGTITGGTWAATDVAVAHGGTGSSTAGGARTNLGVVIGTDVQAYDAELAAIAGLTSAADKGIQFTGSGTAAVYDLTAAGKALLDDANAAAQLVTLGVTATAAEITASIDGDTSATATTLADADRVVVNDGGTMKQVALTDFETYFEAGLDTLNAVTSASSLATVGTIGTGVWEATDVAVAHGGTGASSLTANSLLTGNGTAAIQAEANITYDGTTFGVNDAATFNEGGADNDFRIESANQANMFVVDASVDAIGLLTATPNAGTVLDMSGSTEAFLLPSGTTAQRPGTPAAGMFRYNSTTSKFEYYNGSGWKGATTEFTIVRSETATGDGSTTAFTGLNSSLTTAGCVVTINGVVQLPTTAYAISGTTITFTQAPANSDKIEIREFTTTTSVNALEDADGDTKIQVEESSDEDIIRFDTGGTERMTLTAAGHLVPTLDATYDLGTSSLKWRNMYGVSTSAQYADLAELYESDATYEPGTVVSFGGDAEVTMSTETMDSRIAGVVSTNPAYLMNSDLENGVAIALTGRVPVKVMGTIRKGDMLVAAGEGYAKAEANPRMGSVIGKALEDFNGTNGIIEVVVGRL